MSKYILAIDVSSSACKAYLVDKNKEVFKSTSFPITTISPDIGLVEHDADEIWEQALRSIKVLIKECSIDEIAAIAISNQRETVMAWDENGRSLFNAISWQDQRTNAFFEQYKEHEDLVREKTGLVFNPYFSVSKIKWLLDCLNSTNLRIGTVDSWLIYKLTGNYYTDVSNASRTMLFDIAKLEWSDELLALFEIPKHILPEVKASADAYGYWEYEGKKIPVCAVLGDQQAALYALGNKEGVVNCTYGTGAFLLLNTSNRIIKLPNTITSVAWKHANKVTYILEAASFNCGNVLSKLHSEKAFEYLINNEEYLDAFYLPTQNKRLFIFGGEVKNELSYNVPKEGEPLLKALCNGIALSINELLQSFMKEIEIKELWVNGKISELNYLNSIQASLSKLKTFKSVISNQSAMGVAYLAGVYMGWWKEGEWNKEANAVFEPKELKVKIFEKWREIFYNKC
ncbi:hypothetical protein A6V39_02135 [Candidatus Mycoplasma haematobovis]|uniref:Carbohydrate kinase FGGY N-terminal domain-containing protein n=1 Tax=Candidatus Mycoplasma haematobovis TaxID=432608 RepID=A0A1A9QCP7_9MOLU|nr:FGGY family carbohydrate kinase [Candidatus Mycoplasma haematobovis]OAL10223.1 hypothetical protein A6V39_02135 [Candidatus Mycoplasma haematobovis]